MYNTVSPVHTIYNYKSLEAGGEMEYNTVSPVHTIYNYKSLEAGGEMEWHVQHSKSCSYNL